VTQLHVVHGTDGKLVSLGPTQAKWLKDNGHIVGDPPVYQAVKLGHREIHELTMAQPELRECDFCRHLPSPWEIPVRRFELKHGPQPGPFREFAICCDDCIDFIRARDRDGLFERAVQATVEYAKKQGGYLAAVAHTQSPYAIRRALGPLVKEMIRKTIANMDGEPRRVE
jgi:hypothetical protein